MDDFPLFEFAVAIEDAFDINKLDAIVRLAVDKKLESLAPAGTLFDRALQVVAQAQSAGWWPDLLEAAVKIARHDSGGGPINQKLAAIVAWRATHAPPAAAAIDPFRARYFSGIPFVSRRELRDNLERLAHGEVGAVFVDGAQKSGKSYSWHLLAYLRQDPLRNVHMHVVDLPNWPADMRNAKDIAESILLDLGIDESVPTPAVARDIVRLGIKLGQHIRALDKPYWLVIDGAAQADVEVDDLARDLMTELIKAAVDQKIHNLRVILLGYRNPLLNFRVASEQIALPTRADFEQLLSDIALIEQLPADSERIATLAQQIIDRLHGSAGQAGLTPLSDAIGAALAGLRESPQEPQP